MKYLYKKKGGNEKILPALSLVWLTYSCLWTRFIPCGYAKLAVIDDKSVLFIFFWLSHADGESLTAWGCNFYQQFHNVTTYRKTNKCGDAWGKLTFPKLLFLCPMSYLGTEVRNSLEPGASSQCAEIFNVLHCQMFLIRKRRALVLSFLNKFLAFSALLCLYHTNIYTHILVLCSPITHQVLI